jgi:hypothetical protein
MVIGWPFTFFVCNSGSVIFLRSIRESSFGSLQAVLRCYYAAHSIEAPLTQTPSGNTEGAVFRLLAFRLGHVLIQADVS